MKSGNLNFLEPARPLQACNGTDLPLYISTIQYVGHCGLYRKRRVVQWDTNFDVSFDKPPSVGRTVNRSLQRVKTAWLQNPDTWFRNCSWRNEWWNRKKGKTSNGLQLMQQQLLFTHAIRQTWDSRIVTHSCYTNAHLKCRNVQATKKHLLLLIFS